MRTITIEVDDTVFSLLQVLTKGQYAPKTVEDVVLQLIDHAQQGVYRPGAWERNWLISAFSDDFVEHLEPGDPYGRADSEHIFQRPRAAEPSKKRPRRTNTETES